MQTILVMGGSFNPPTRAHLDLMTAALNTLGGDKGIFVPSSHTYVSVKMKRAKHPKEVLSQDLRLQMLRAMAEEDERLGVDDLEFYRTERAYTYETMEALQEKYPDATLYFLAGGDKVEIIPRWHRIREFLDRFHIIVTKRDDYDPAEAIEANPFLQQHRDKFHVIPAPAGLEGISSSAVRDCLREGRDGAAELLHPGVWALLQKNGGMKHEN